VRPASAKSGSTSAVTLDCRFMPCPTSMSITGPR
jgi:hypothetical protein